MSVVNSNHFAEGWQKKGTEEISDNLRDVREELTKQDQTSAGKTMDSLAQAKTNKSTEGTKPDSTRANTDVEKQAEQARARPETREQGTKLQSQEQAFQKARSNARNLGELVGKGAQANGKAATQEAVVSRNPAQDANLQQNTNQQSAGFTLSQTINQVPHQQVNPQIQQTVQNTNPQTQPQRGTRTSDPQQSQFVNEQVHVATDAAHQAAQAARSGLTPTAQPTDTTVVKREGGGDKDVSKEKKSKQSSSKSGGVYGARATRDLDDLLGGVSVDVGSGGSDDGAEVFGSAPAVINEIPEEDGSMKVFNEFDTANPGIEMLLAKRNILEHHVVKRLKEIQELDHSIDNKISDIYATKSLSDRIVGELKDELSSAKFHKSVYGGLIG